LATHVQLIEELAAALHELGLRNVHPTDSREITIHCSPNHGSWLNMAEIELSVLSGQCLDRRIGEETMHRQKVADRGRTQ